MCMFKSDKIILSNLRPTMSGICMIKILSYKICSDGKSIKITTDTEISSGHFSIKHFKDKIEKPSNLLLQTTKVPNLFLFFTMGVLIHSIYKIVM
jgi:hypothetical protein